MIVWVCGRNHISDYGLLFSSPISTFLSILIRSLNPGYSSGIVMSKNCVNLFKKVLVGKLCLNPKKIKARGSESGWAMLHALD